MNAWLLVLIAATVNSAAGLMLKQSRVAADGSAIWLLAFSPWFFAACTCYLVNVFLFAKSLDYLPLSVVYPVYASAGFMIIAVVGNILFKETLGFIQLLGVVLIISGIAALARTS
jgi:multidrug transporter EmrE-like cation transporter